MTSELLRNQHLQYLLSLDKKEKTTSSFRAESIKMGGAYWAYSSVAMLRVPIPPEKSEKLIMFIRSCFEESSGGFGWSTGHDGHITATHYAVLMLAQLGHKLDVETSERVLDFTRKNQKPDGSFQCDRWGETDMRFVYNAACILSLLDPSGWKSRINFSNMISHVHSCQNSDGGFCPNPSLESHAAYTFCAVGVLVISGEPVPRADRLAHWLAERQTPTGGFNGRPEKAPDVCYSWWILSTLEMLGRSHWIDKEALAKFILRAQEPQNGGIADRPECVPDVFHTFFGLTGLSLIDHGKYGLNAVNVKYAIVDV